MSEEGEYAPMPEEPSVKEKSAPSRRSPRAQEEEREEEETDEGEEEGEREDKEILFLIEFLVDTLCINIKNLNYKNMDPCMFDGQTSVALTFLNFPPMTLTETDWGPENDDNTEEMIKFNAGKSLMFALSESQLHNPPPIYLDVSAQKTMAHGGPDAQVPIGKTKICLTELFKQVFEKIDDSPSKYPLSKSIKDSYSLVGPNSKKPAGEIVIYIRLSCLGQNVVTEFQRGDECEPFLFKNKESNKVYECKAKEDSSDGNINCPCTPGPGDAAGPRSNRGGAAYSEDLDDNEFEEFATEVHGHALTLKIQKSRKAAQKGDSECNGHDCGKGGKAGNQIAFQVPNSQNYCKESNARARIHPLKDCGPESEPLRITAGAEGSDDKDVFLLRIGKKGEVHGKGKLELELRTPKPKKDRTPKGPKKVNREAQTDKEEKEGKKGKRRK